MHIKWLETVDSSVVQEFLDFIKGLYPNPNGSSKRLRRKAVFDRIYVPILEAGLESGEYIIPETPEFANLCRKLGVNPLEISADLQQLYAKMGKTVDTAFAAAYLKLPQEKVQHLARLGLLLGEKKSGRWQFPVHQLRLPR